VVEKLIIRKHGRHEMATVAGVQTVESHGQEEVTDDEDGATVVTHWRSGKAASNYVTEPSQWATPDVVRVVSIVDHSNQESVCTALLVGELLKRFFPLTAAGHVLGPEESLPTSVTTLLVMCSNGCFQKPSFVRQLLQTKANGIGAIPIIVEERFQFPSDALFQELRPLSAHVLSDAPPDLVLDDLIAIIKNLFEEIGIHVRPQDSQEALEVRAAAVAKRLSAPRAAISTKLRANRAFTNREEVFDLEVEDDGPLDQRVKL